jgi:hypothetical protein
MMEQLAEAKALLAQAMELISALEAKQYTEPADIQGNCSSCKYKGLPEGMYPCCECIWGGVIDTNRLLWESAPSAPEKSCLNCRHEDVDAAMLPCSACDSPDDQWQAKASGPDVNVYGCSTCKHEDQDSCDEPCNECYWGTEDAFSVNRWVAKED